MTKERKLLKKIIKYRDSFSKEEFDLIVSFLILRDCTNKVNSMINKYITPWLDKINNVKNLEDLDE